MFNKDTFRLIKKTFNRFISLVCIVFIGVSFMMGLLSTSSIMSNTISNYDHSQKLFDIQLYSSYGFCDDDVSALEADECVNAIFSSKQTDVYCSFIDTEDECVVRFRELDSEVNQYDIIYGRKPTSDNEILVLADNDSLLGKKINVYLKDSEISEYLTVTEFEIVGVAKSSEYLSKFSNTSNLNNLDLDYIFYAANEIFCFDYYTTIYIYVEGSENYNRFEDEYVSFIDEAKDNIEYIALNKQDDLKATILLEYQEEIEKGQEELEKAKIEGQQQLDDAKNQLDEANVKIIMLEVEIDTAKTAIDTLNSRLKVEKDLLSDLEKSNDLKIKQIEEEKGESFETVYTKATSAYTTYISLLTVKSSDAKEGYQKIIDNLETENNNQLSIIEEANKELELLNEQYKEETVEDEKNIIAEKIKEKEETIASANEIIATNNEIIDRLKSAQSGSYDTIIDAALKAIDDEYGGSIETTYKEYTIIVENSARVLTEKDAVAASENTLNTAISKLNELEDTISSARQEYEDGLKEYKEGLIKFQNEIEEAEIKLRKASQDLEELPEAKWIILDSSSHYDSVLYKNSCDQMRSIGIVIPILFFLVAALVCLTTMTRLVDEQRGQIGIYCALGFSKKAVLAKYATYAFLACVIGSVIAIPCGLYTFPVIIYVTWGILYRNPEITISVPIIPLIVSILSFTILIVIVTLIVTNKSLKEMPSQLMRPKAPKKAKKVFLEKIPFIWNSLSFTSKITARNIIRYKSRFFMTIIGVAGCTSLLVLGFGIKDSIKDVVNIQYGQIFNYQYTVGIENDADSDAIIEKFEDNLLNEKVVPYMTYSGNAYLEDDTEVINIEVINPRDALNVLHLWSHESNEDLKISNSGVIISAKFAKLHNLDVGDSITISSRGGLKNVVEIEGICEMYFQHYCFMSEAYYKSLFNENIKYSNLAIVNYGELEDVISEDVEGITGVFDFSSFTRTFDTMISALDYIILIIIIVGGALAFVVLINLTQVNISERIREIATLKVLGFNDKEINGYIFKEIFILTILGGLVGLPLGKIEEAFVMDVIDMEMVMFPHNIYPISYLYAYLITFVFTIIVLFFTRKPLRKIEMIESLKSVE